VAGVTGGVAQLWVVRQLCEDSTVNEPMPLQLTVGKLRQALQIAPDEAIVGLRVPASGIGHQELTTYYNLRVDYSGGMILRFTPWSTSPDSQGDA